MSTRDFSGKLKLVLKHEGGYVDHKEDPGGATNLGVTIGTLSSWLGRPATKAEVRALTVAKVTPIYKMQYWDKIQGDLLPEGLDYAVFDYAVNSGPGKAARDLQRVLGVKQDGSIGINTLAAVRSQDLQTLINKYMDRRLAFLKGLKTWKTFGRGWKIRVDGVRAAALKMAASEKPKVAALVAPELATMASQKAEPSDQAVSKTVGGQAGGLAGLSAIGAGASEAAQSVVGLTEYLEIAKWIFLGLTLVGTAVSLYIAYKKATSQADAE